MEELSHLEIWKIAERCQGELELIEHGFRDAGNRNDGPELLACIGRLEHVYPELAALVDDETRNLSDESLALTRERFKPERLQQNEELSQAGAVSLGSVLRASRFAAESLERCVRNLRDGKEFDKDFHEAFNRTTAALGYAYQITREAK